MAAIVLRALNGTALTLSSGSCPRLLIPRTFLPLLILVYPEEGGTRFTGIVGTRATLENYNYRIACLIVNYVRILIALFQDVEDAFLYREVPLHCSGLALFEGDIKVDLGVTCIRTVTYSDRGM
jgi:hypothetical protein